MTRSPMLLCGSSFSAGAAFAKGGKSKMYPAGNGIFPTNIGAYSVAVRASTTRSVAVQNDLFELFIGWTVLSYATNPVRWNFPKRYLHASPKRGPTFRKLTGGFTSSITGKIAKADRRPQRSQKGWKAGCIGKWRKMCFDPAVIAGHWKSVRET